MYFFDFKKVYIPGREPHLHGDLATPSRRFSHTVTEEEPHTLSFPLIKLFNPKGDEGLRLYYLYQRPALKMKPLIFWACSTRLQAQNMKCIRLKSRRHSCS